MMIGPFKTSNELNKLAEECYKTGRSAPLTKESDQVIRTSLSILGRSIYHIDDAKFLKEGLSGYLVGCGTRTLLFLESEEGAVKARIDKILNTKKNRPDSVVLKVLVGRLTQLVDGVNRMNGRIRELNDKRYQNTIRYQGSKGLDSYIVVSEVTKPSREMGSEGLRKLIYEIRTVIQSDYPMLSYMLSSCRDFEKNVLSIDNLTDDHISTAWDLMVAKQVMEEK